MYKRDRELLAAAIVKDYRFSDEETYKLYLNDLDSRNIRYKVEETYKSRDGSFLARISIGYNESPLLQLYED